MVLCWRCLADKRSFAHGFYDYAVKWNFLKLDLLGGKRRSLSLSLPELKLKVLSRSQPPF